MTELFVAWAAADAAVDPGAAGSLLDSLLRWAKIETGWQAGLVVFGFVAQGLFFLRWVIQWIATERRGESHVPVLFWWVSLVGASLLFVYFALRAEPVGMLGQSIGWLVYARNLHLLRKKPLPPGGAGP